MLKNVFCSTNIFIKLIVRAVVVVVVLLFSIRGVAQQQIDTVSVDQTESSVFKFTDISIVETFKTGIDVVTSPFQKWDNTKIYNTILLFGSASFSYFFIDEICKDFIDDNISESGKRFGKTVSEFGNPVFVGSTVLGLGAAGLISKNSQLSRTTYLSAQSFIISMTLCYVTKHLSGRLRPDYSTNNDMWYGPNWQENHKRSFYSGHTTALFSVATVFALEYKDVSWVPPVLYLFAGSISVSRIIAGDHWMSDVVFAAGISHLVARKVVNRYHKSEEKYTVVPFFSNKEMGLIVKF